jgi:hypothetical protein
VTGGSFGIGFRALDGSTVEISAGQFADRFYVHSDAQATISGGVFGRNFRAYVASTISFHGSEFFLDGVPIQGLVAGQPTLVADRDATLSGVLADGTPFAFELGSIDYEKKYFGTFDTSLFPYDYFDVAAKLSIVLVPEQSSCALSLIALAAILTAFRNRKNRRISADSVERKDTVQSGQDN